MPGPRRSDTESVQCRHNGVVCHARQRWCRLRAGSTGTVNFETGATRGMDLPQIWENRVRFEETDRQGIVFYGNYVTFQDETITQYFRETGVGYPDIESRGWDVHVVNVELNYHGQADVGDELVHGARVDSFGTSSMTFEYAAHQADNGSRIADGTVTHVTVDPATGDPVRVPEEFRETVRRFQDEPPTE